MFIAALSLVGPVGHSVIPTPIRSWRGSCSRNICREKPGFAGKVTCGVRSETSGQGWPSNTVATESVHRAKPDFKVWRRYPTQTSGRGGRVKLLCPENLALSTAPVLSDKALAHACQVLEQRREANRGLEPLLQSLRSLRPFERFVVKDKKRIFFVPVSNVLWIEATGNYACIHTASDSHLLRETMAHLEEKLAPHHFLRVRKSAIVNGACISEIRPMFDGVYDIVLAEGTVVTSSRRYAHKLRALLES
jgi:hypothetical protein